MMRIPLNRPAVLGKEWAYIRDAVKRGHLSGDGHYTAQVSTLLEKQLRLPRVLLTSSCTHALELAFLLLDLPRGGEVLCPSFTFSSTVNAFLLRGLKPRFVDIRPDTLNMDESQLDAEATSRTRAVVPVHYAGVPCDMKTMMAFAKRKRLAMVEDAAQALGATCEGKPAGSFGVLNAFSFHETKNCSCGEGGALAIRDPKLIERAEILRQKGTNRAQFYRGEVDKYTWTDLGSSFVPSELQSAYLLAQLEKQTVILKRRRALYEQYQDALAPLATRGILQLPVIPRNTQSSYHLFHIILQNPAERDRLMGRLKAQGILATFHYWPLHLSPMGRRLGYRKGDFPITEKMASCLLRLPFYTVMTSAEQRRVIAAVRKSF